MTTLAPAQAIEYLETKELQPTWDWTEQLTINNANVFVVAKAAKMSILQDIRNEVLNAIENGETLRGFQKRLEPTLRAKGWWGKVLDENTGKTIQLGSPHRLKTIYQTNLQSSYAAGRWTRQEDGKAERPYLMYDALMDMSTRPAHAALNGIVKRVDDPFWRTHYPPNGYNSFIPDTKMRGTFQSGTRRLYAGEIVTIKTAEGRSLTVTPNHPIPTPSGFIAAGYLRKGFDIFGYCGGVEIMTGSSPSAAAQKYNYIPFPIKDIFDFMEKIGSLFPGQIGPNDFYGDIYIGDRYIDVVDLQGELHNGIKSIFLDNLKNFSFKTPDTCQCSHLTLGVPEFFFERFLAPFGSIPSIAALANYGFSILSDLAPFKKFSHAPTSSGYSVFPENTDDNTSTYSKFFGQLQNGFPGIVKTDKIIDVIYNNFRGHVFDLQSPSGLIIANNIVVSNCRCSAVALTPEEAGEAKREHKQPRNIPDPDKGFNSNPGLKRWKPLKSNYDEDIWRTAND